jgi:hypothetical protein
MMMVLQTDSSTIDLMAKGAKEEEQDADDEFGNTKTRGVK